MIQNMVVVIVCPGCGEENRFTTRIPKRGDELSCPNCGKRVAVNDEFLEELTRVIQGMRLAVEDFVQMY
jgi:DNA-directed RNA polymerase subunit RPC12/RpoP